MRRASSIAGALIALGLLLTCGCGGDDDDSAAPQTIAVLSAFPAEMVPILEETSVEDTVAIDDHLFRVGTLRGVRVVVGMTGIGLANATAMTSAVLDHFDIDGIVVSGVAGSPNRIGDVTVPEAWELMEGGTYATHPPWYELARQLADTSAVSFERCTEVPPVLSEEPVCVPHVPALFLGGVGRSEDSQSQMARPCTPGGDDVFGCDIPSTENDLREGEAPAEPLFPNQARREARPPDGTTVPPRADATGMNDPEINGTAAEPSAVDMETAAIGRIASSRGVPFIAFRAVSDGAGDPLNLPGFPAQFFAYYKLAARNAAAATVAFLDRLADRTDLLR